MALSMDEQRILAEIEQHLAQSEPALAARFSALGRVRGPGAGLSRRVLGAIATALMVAVISMVVYALVSLRSAQPPVAARHAPASQQVPNGGTARTAP